MCEEQLLKHRQRRSWWGVEAALAAAAAAARQGGCSRPGGLGAGHGFVLSCSSPLDVPSDVSAVVLFGISSDTTRDCTMGFLLAPVVRVVGLGSSKQGRQTQSQTSQNKEDNGFSTLGTPVEAGQSPRYLNSCHGLSGTRVASLHDANVRSASPRRAL